MGHKTENIFERAKTNLRKNNHENALRLFNQVLNREPSHKEALRNKAFIKIIRGEKEEAGKFLLFALEHQPEDDQLYQMLGTLYYNNQEPQKALAQFKKAIDLNNSNFAAQQGIGMLYAQNFGDHRKAIEHFSAAIEIDNTNADLFFNRGCSHMVLKEMTKAETDLRKAEELGHKKARSMVTEYF